MSRPPRKKTPPVNRGRQVRSVKISKDALDRAARKQGWATNGQAAAGVGVSESSWMRWRRAGAIPEDRITDVALRLGMPPPRGLREPQRMAWDIKETLSSLLREVQALRERVDDFEIRLEQVPAPDGRALRSARQPHG